jgi:hypothetical protein
MSNWISISVMILLFAAADIPRVKSLRPPERSVEEFPLGEEITFFPCGVTQSSGGQQAQSDARGESKAQSAPKSAPLKETSKLALIRYVSGEFAKAVKPLPAGKDGFLTYVDKPLNQELLDRAVATHGAAVNTGDDAQITRLEFREHTIVVDVNGGGKGKRSWRDRIHFEVGAPIPTVQTTTTQEQTGPPGIRPGMGSTIFLEFTKPLPDMSADDLKQFLSPFLNFAKARSAAVQWFDTLPPEMKKAIQERRPVVGMDREEVVAAIGKPEHKIRERDSEGNDIEDWIYGQPPSKTVFVRFVGDHVTSIKQFPQ